MFTGIVMARGRLLALRHRAGGGASVSIATPKTFLEGKTKVGDSIACNGVCLTATALGEDSFEADLSEETLKTTCFKHYTPGRVLNLELACTPNTRLGGHLVSGHVDGIGRVLSRVALAGSVELTIKSPKALARYISRKGSIAVDGVSLTVNEVEGDCFKLALISHTQAETASALWVPDAEVNLEVDIIARYLERLWQYGKAGLAELTPGESWGISSEAEVSALTLKTLEEAGLA